MEGIYDVRRLDGLRFHKEWFIDTKADKGDTDTNSMEKA
jgi:hypothetical protein